MSTVGPRFLNFYRVLDEPREHGAAARTFRLLVGVLLTALVMQVLVATVLHDGAGLLRGTLEKEAGWVESRHPATAGRLVRWMDTAHEWGFRRSGIEQLALHTRNPLGASLAREAQRLYEGLVASVQLLTLRLGILILTLPLLAILLLVALVEGWANWYLRRLGGARESSFLYHRFKKAAKVAIPALLVVYLVPPVPLDPMWVLPPFLGAILVSLATSLALFKKHL